MYVLKQLATPSSYAWWRVSTATSLVVHPHRPHRHRPHRTSHWVVVDLLQPVPRRQIPSHTSLNAHGSTHCCPECPQQSPQLTLCAESRRAYQEVTRIMSCGWWPPLRRLHRCCWLEGGRPRCTTKTAKSTIADPYQACTSPRCCIRAGDDRSWL